MTMFKSMKRVHCELDCAWYTQCLAKVRALSTDAFSPKIFVECHLLVHLEWMDPSSTRKTQCTQD